MLLQFLLIIIISDASGFLMQSSYQPVIKINEDTPYSPGFPMRAYEFGTDPYQGQFEVYIQ
jgi:hypothetical protein